MICGMETSKSLLFVVCFIFQQVHVLSLPTQTTVVAAVPVGDTKTEPHSVSENSVEVAKQDSSHTVLDAPDKSHTTSEGSVEDAKQDSTHSVHDAPDKPHTTSESSVEDAKQNAVDLVHDVQHATINGNQAAPVSSGQTTGTGEAEDHQQVTYANGQANNGLNDETEKAYVAAIGEIPNVVNKYLRERLAMGTDPNVKVTNVPTYVTDSGDGFVDANSVHYAPQGVQEVPQGGWQNGDETGLQGSVPLPDPVYYQTPYGTTFVSPAYSVLPEPQISNIPHASPYWEPYALPYAVSYGSVPEGTYFQDDVTNGPDSYSQPQYPVQY